NNDIELRPASRGLLDVMYQKAMKKDVGAVGCVLLYEDGKTIQHAGVYLVAGGTADHLYAGRNYKKVLKGLASAKSVMPNIVEDRQVTAVTAAAVMIQRTKFKSIEGLNEDFIICGGDVDMCLRLEDRGF